MFPVRNVGLLGLSWDDNSRSGMTSEIAKGEAMSSRSTEALRSKALDRTKTKNRPSFETKRF
jgi:hypothetical protein